jgi:putative restriction endonuclease
MSSSRLVIGPTADVAIGTVFANRVALAEARVHRVRMHGIAWSRGAPAESIVQSGGYEDDAGWGDTLLYTGMGGNEGGRHIADQELRLGNLALVRALELQTPVRVVRGAGQAGPFSPHGGLRYDGLFPLCGPVQESGSTSGTGECDLPSPGGSPAF